MDEGAGLVALLGGLVTLAVVVVVVLMTLPGSQPSQSSLPALPTAGAPTPTARAGAPSKTTGTTQDEIQGIVGSAADVVCRTDYGAVEAAVNYYEAGNGSAPKSMADLTPMLSQPVSSPYFSITIDPSKPGVVEVSARGRAPAPGDANCAFAGQ